MFRDVINGEAMKLERRHHSRYTVNLQVAGQELPSLEYTGETHPSFHASAENISLDGIHLLSDHRVHQSSLVCCQILLPGIPAPIPVLMKVQWVREVESQKFRIGLKYLVSAAAFSVQTA